MPLTSETQQPVGDAIDDICERLRSEIVFEPEVGELLADAAAEIERLRQSADKRGTLAVDRRREIERLRLTDDERQAIRWIVGDDLSADGVSIQATLRGLLERHAPGTYRKNDKNAPVSDTIRGVTEPMPKEKRA